MATTRLSEARYRELLQKFGEMESRLDRLEQLEQAGTLLAEALGTACLHVLKVHPRAKERNDDRARAR